MSLPLDVEEVSVVETRGLSLSFEGRMVLEDVSFRVPSGRIVALIGPNGSGKTTLLRALLGLTPPDSGQVLLFGKPDIRHALPRIGYVPQRLQLDRSFVLSVREFLALRLPGGANWFWRSRSSLDQSILELVPDLGLEALLGLPLPKLSGGQLQRVLIGFSLLRQPELLLLDEPTAGVDTPGEKTFYELIAAIHRKRQMTVVLVSHDLGMVFRYASWVYALNRRICCEGPPESVLNADSLREAYGIHVTPYHHHHHAH